MRRCVSTATMVTRTRHYDVSPTCSTCYLAPVTTAQLPYLQTTMKVLQFLTITVFCSGVSPKVAVSRLRHLHAGTTCAVHTLHAGTTCAVHTHYTLAPRVRYTHYTLAPRVQYTHIAASVILLVIPLLRSSNAYRRDAHQLGDALIA